MQKSTKTLGAYLYNKTVNEPPEFEEAEIREVHQPVDHPAGAVRIRGERRWLLPAIVGGILLLLLLLLLLPSEEEERGVSLEAARERILQEDPPLRKNDVIRILREDGFLVSPGRPRGALEIGVVVRREGIVLRGGGRRELIAWTEFS